MALGVCETIAPEVFVVKKKVFNLRTKVLPEIEGF